MEANVTGRGMKEFRNLEAVHAEIDRKLDEHQLALVRSGFDRAHRLFEEYRAAIRQHIEDEESLLLPLYEERVKIEPGGSAAPYRAEHAKLERMMESIDARLRRLENIRLPADAHDFIRCIEQEFELKRLWLAHALRERNILFPALDAATDEEEREWLLSRCRGNGGDAA